MNRLLISFAVFAAIYSFSPGVDARELIKEFTGSESKNTTEEHYRIRGKSTVDSGLAGEWRLSRANGGGCKPDG